ncbi:YciI family protein [Wenjunlia tyrosinilytica]|nr:YciI family protein [Wenjunlia tyrosinilytica]
MLLIKSDANAEAGVMPSPELIDAMGKYNEELVKAGVLLAAEGLQPSSKGAKVHYSGGKRTVTDGPFAEAKELIAGFWIIQAKSKEEALEWALRVPLEAGDPQSSDGVAEIEVRQVFDISDFPEDVLSPEAAAREEALRLQVEKNAAGQ